MRRNEAHKLTFEDQIDGDSMESRIARIEANVSHINSTLATVQVDLRELRNGLNVANESIAGLDAKCEGQFTALRAEIRATASALESKLIKWLIGTVIASMGIAIASGGVAIAIAKVVFGSKMP